MNTSCNDNRIQSALWSLLLLTVVLIAWPVYADDVESNYSGKIQEINLNERYVVVQDVQYKVPLNAALVLVANTGNSERIIAMSELERGQYAEFQLANDGNIKSLRAYEEAPQ